MKSVNVRRKGKRQRKANKKFVKLVKSVKIRLDSKTVITCRESVIDKWRSLYPNMEVIA